MAHPPLGLRWHDPARALSWLRALGLRLEANLAEERSRQNLWLPVAFAVGIGIYFALPAEPWSRLWLVLIAAGGLLPLVAPARTDGSVLGTLLLWGLAAVLIGIATGQLRSQLVAAPVLERRGAYQVEGEVALVDARLRGLRLLVEAPLIEGLAPEVTPTRVRFTVRETGIAPGDLVRARVMLMPPSPPAAPGDFDFARRAFFERLGAVGYALGPVETIERHAGERWLAGARHRIAEQIREAVPGPEGAVAVALMTGLRGGIPDEVWDDMQAAGIAHLLAISGLHLGLVAGTIFFAIRIAIALVPPLALRIPGKKVAALIALFAAFGYLLLTGATVPTRRAFIMTALALVAIMFDRNPFSMRLVAFAGLIVLALQPESLLGPSFQMSFAAVVTLIAAYETGIGQRPDRLSGLDRRVLLYFTGVGLTTLIASVATAPFAAFHFHRFASYGVVANLVAVPLTAFWIMPQGLLGVLALPFGLDRPCFWLMGEGIGLMLAVAGRVADLPGAALRVPEMPAASLILITLGGLWLCIWRGRWRRFGLVGVVFGIGAALPARPPDLLIDRTGRLVAVRLDDGRVALGPYERDRWVTSQWLERLGQRDPASWPASGSRDDLRCDPLGCVLARHGRTVALARRPEALEDDCARANLVIGYPRLERCPNGTQLIGPEALRKAGGLALWIGTGGIEVLTNREARGDRPWVR